MKICSRAAVLLAGLLLVGCYSKPKDVINVDDQLQYCEQKAALTIDEIKADSLLPRNIAPDQNHWNNVKYTDWTSGSWPGILWYIYEHDQNDIWKERANQFTEYLLPLSLSTAVDHDLGFQVFNSYGNGYRITKNNHYKEVLLRTADSLATLFNPNVGTILSWPRPVPNMEWPQHNTIMDNLINLELLFWASKNGGDQSLYEMAVSHAETTMKYHFRDDYTSYHVVVYDRESGEKIKAVTHQGFSDSSTWARGQAWAIYGYTMIYRETKDPKFLDFAQKVTEPYLSRLPNDQIPFWDFDAPDIPNAPKDASAAAVVASALLELADYCNAELATKYRNNAVEMLKSLSSPSYLSGSNRPSFLDHSTGHYPKGSEIDYSIIYADYYYIEALIRLKRVQEGQKAVL